MIEANKTRLYWEKATMFHIDFQVVSMKLTMLIAGLN